MSKHADRSRRGPCGVLAALLLAACGQAAAQTADPPAPAEPPPASAPADAAAGPAAEAAPAPADAAEAATQPETAGVADTPADAPAGEPAPVTDRVRESAIADALARVRGEGEVQWLGEGEGKFLALWREDVTGAPKGAALILHDMGGNADSPDVIGPLRRGLPDAGWSTLSIQLPLPAAGQPRSAYRGFLPEVSRRIDLAVAQLRTHNPAAVVLIGHGSGAYMAASYANQAPAAFAALVGIDFPEALAATPAELPALLEALEIPVLDVYGSRANPDVLQGAAERKAAARRAGNQHYRQVALQGADPLYTGLDFLLVKLVRGYMDRNAAAALAESAARPADG